MLPTPVGTDACSLEERWILTPILAQDLVRMDRVADARFATAGIRWPGLWILDGYRTQEAQDILNPDVKDSLHRRCPSLAADLRVGPIAGISSIELLQFAGGIWMAFGHRWGGIFSDFPNPAHFDVGRIPG